METVKRIYIDSIQESADNPDKKQGYILEYYKTKDEFVSAINNDSDVKEYYYDFIMDKLDDPAKNRQYAKLTLFYDFSSGYTVEHNIWLTFRTKDNKPVSVFEIILSRLDLTDFPFAHSVEGRTFIRNYTNTGDGFMEAYIGVDIYPYGHQSIYGSDEVYYECCLDERFKERFKSHYKNSINECSYWINYKQYQEIRFMEMAY